ncbi:MAG: C39 family peptidase [Cocleimonas sp.]|nr:C39 family peptidase [Cocleimonas sp.]
MYILNVPLEAQQKKYTCWHASALMIWRYSQGRTGRAGPMHSLGEKWKNNKAIYPSEFIRLAKNVGLLPLANTTNVSLPESTLEGFLKDHGPIWCAGYWYGKPHIVVLTGVANNMVFINDPNKGVAKLGSLLWFNNKLASQYAGCMMVKNSARY